MTGLRSALIPPRLTHQVIATSDRMAFCFFDPSSAWHRGCRVAMTQTHDPITYQHTDEASLIHNADSLRTAQQASEWLDIAAGPLPHDISEPTCDPRITAAVSALHHLDPHQRQSAGELAELVGLSSSRFLHVFHDQTGTTLRRYRLWLRMLRAAALLSDTADLTAAAAEAGFASPSHLTSSFHTMFGLPPSRLRGTTIHVIPPDTGW